MTLSGMAASLTEDNAAETSKQQTGNGLRAFTLEDLNFGGTNYHNMVPKNRYTTWWGDEARALGR